MDLETLLSFNWMGMMPEFIILGVATLLSLTDLFMKPDQSRRWLGWVGVMGIAAALISLLLLLKEPQEISILFDTFVLDYFAKSFKPLLLNGALIVMMMSIDYEPREEGKDRGEFYYLLLTALLGAMIMSSSRDLITLFVGLELLSISSYILAGLRKKNVKSNEAAMKYVVNGGISTAITLFGMSYVYGLTGTTSLNEMIPILNELTDSNYQYLMGLSFFMIFVGLSFKIATVPFHMWAPDVYEGAPLPVTAFLSVVSKTAGFIIILRIFLSIFGNTPYQNMEPMILSLKVFLAVLAALTMILGNVVALRQKNVKRMLAYSSISHAGYVLVGFVSISQFFYFDAIWFYLGAYLFMNIGAFAVLQVISNQIGSAEIESFAGLFKRSPFIAITFTIFLISLAGFPGTAGFIGKLVIFLSSFTTQAPMLVLVSIMLAATVVSYFYYFGIITQMFFRPQASEQRIKLPVPSMIVLVICLVATVLLGLFPSLAFEYYYQTIS
ncbi:NADH-quinone oxidoreductase subunit NuoN [Metabacillus arenae]|uniref:NADH-quinone oxidoreductase subunit N n=1 Tax=Metabacillus arenae TaxID=2771434 RepID=A0A926NLF1_9BACI|nr:NADH-quinone oxidoreductase subunit NuoN [Metabacillus arenae]MBD1383230.1 NADH-quinone oxidoreductase subunit NuoN [Metabacillus arenae]